MVFLVLFVFAGIKNHNAGKTTDPKDGQAAKQDATSPDSVKPPGNSRQRRLIIIPLTLIGVIYSVYLVFCFTFLLPLYGKDFDKSAEPFFNATTDMPLFY